jgi:hypothetical protein
MYTDLERHKNESLTFGKSFEKSDKVFNKTRTNSKKLRDAIYYRHSHPNSIFCICVIVAQVQQMDLAIYHADDASTHLIYALCLQEARLFK